MMDSEPKCSVNSENKCIKDEESNSLHGVKKSSSKPLMEKKRRARINNSLQELKSILLDGENKETLRSTKMEKADILEMTVNHLKLHRSQNNVHELVKMQEGQQVRRFKAGYATCSKEILKFLEKEKSPFTSRLRLHLTSHLDALERIPQSQLCNAIMGSSPTEPDSTTLISPTGNRSMTPPYVIVTPPSPIAPPSPISPNWNGHFQFPPPLQPLNLSPWRPNPYSPPLSYSPYPYLVNRSYFDSSVWRPWHAPE